MAGLRRLSRLGITTCQDDNMYEILVTASKLSMIETNTAGLIGLAEKLFLAGALTCTLYCEAAVVCHRVHRQRVCEFVRKNLYYIQTVFC